MSDERKKQQNRDRVRRHRQRERQRLAAERIENDQRIADLERVVDALAHALVLTAPHAPEDAQARAAAAFNAAAALLGEAWVGHITGRQS